MKLEDLIRETELAVHEIDKKFNNPYDFFKEMKKIKMNKIQLMLLDSAIKNIPLEGYDKTLLLTGSYCEENLNDILQKLLPRLLY